MTEKVNIFNISSIFDEKGEKVFFVDWDGRLL